jgi:hypothetical protein
MMLGVHQQQLFSRGFRCIDMSEHIEKARFDKSIFYRSKAPGIFRVARTSVMLAAVGVADICSAQSGMSLL